MSFPNYDFLEESNYRFRYWPIQTSGASDEITKYIKYLKDSFRNGKKVKEPLLVGYSTDRHRLVIDSILKEWSRLFTDPVGCYVKIKKVISCKNKESLDLKNEIFYDLTKNDLFYKKIIKEFLKRYDQLELVSFVSVRIKGNYQEELNRKKSDLDKALKRLQAYLNKYRDKINTRLDNIVATEQGKKICNQITIYNFCLCQFYTLLQQRMVLINHNMSIDDMFNFMYETTRELRNQLTFSKREILILLDVSSENNRLWDEIAYNNVIGSLRYKPEVIFGTTTQEELGHLPEMFRDMFKTVHLLKIEFRDEANTVYINGDKVIEDTLYEYRFLKLLYDNYSQNSGKYVTLLEIASNVWNEKVLEGKFHRKQDTYNMVSKLNSILKISYGIYIENKSQSKSYPGGYKLVL